MLLIKKVQTPIVLVSMLLLLATASFSVSAESRSSELLKAADKKVAGKYVRQRYVELLNKPFASSTKKKVLILGDSHAQDFVNMVFENNYLKNYQIITRDIPTRCQPILGGNETKFIESKDKSFCAKADSLAKAKQQIDNADVIILAANWKDWSAKELPQTIKNLHLKSEQKLLILGRKSFGKVSVRKYLRMSDKELRNLRNEVDSEQEAINKIMKATVNKSIYIDTQQLLCGSSSTCRVFTSDLKLISFDGGHLTKEGAKYVGNILFRDSQLADL